uniref:Uncharacterized protein n=1 Tax=Knipowitschia caucasica TaxID=637954 RepID=A0AAV2M8K5_KNICA
MSSDYAQPSRVTSGQSSDPAGSKQDTICCTIPLLSAYHVHVLSLSTAATGSPAHDALTAGHPRTRVRRATAEDTYWAYSGRGQASPQREVLIGVGQTSGGHD